MNGMADVVDRPVVPVLPRLRHFHRAHVVLEERTAQLAARLVLERDARIAPRRETLPDGDSPSAS